MPMYEPESLRCYALRRLNPFLGVVQIVETPKVRASTSNGLVWHIELQDGGGSWGSLNAMPGEQGWYLHGLWSEREGLVEAPVGAARGSRRARDYSMRLIERIAGMALPFDLVDRRELWLLDADQGLPLALLDATRPAGRPPVQGVSRRWVGCFGSDGVAGQRRFPAIAELERQVRERAGFNLRRLWVEWDEGRRAVHTADGEALPVDSFPPLGLREDWPTPVQRQRAADYFRWTAPSLLTLPWLDDRRRCWLEDSLHHQACSIEYHWRLYPRVLQPERITAARVQTRMQEPGHAVADR